MKKKKVQIQIRRVRTMLDWIQCAINSQLQIYYKVIPLYLLYGVMVIGAWSRPIKWWVIVRLGWQITPEAEGHETAGEREFAQLQPVNTAPFHHK